ncbi:SxtJ family membrane protein [Pseudomonadota bacterium]
MKPEITNLGATGYRNFGLISSTIVIALFGILIPWLFSLNFPLWPWILGGVLSTWALLAPATLKPVYTGWMRFGLIMNWINTRLILGIMFYGMFLPIGMLMRLMGKDPMHRTLDSETESYRVESHNDSRDNMERPY